MATAVSVFICFWPVVGFASSSRYFRDSVAEQLLLFDVNGRSGSGSAVSSESG